MNTRNNYIKIMRKERMVKWKDKFGMRYGD